MKIVMVEKRNTGRLKELRPFVAKDYTHRFQKTSQDKIPSYYLALLFGYLFLLAYLTSVIDNDMPNVISDADAGKTEFSEERAWRYLREIVGNGPRVAGTNYHLEKTEDLRNLVGQVTKNASLPVHVEWQMITGDYWLGYSRPFLNMYYNSSNIIAVLEGKSGFNADGSTNTSILFNCHYDTRPTSPGASDNALFCAAMMEVLSLLSKRETKFKHNIVFLFNGAEENPLQGAPGFLQHPWSKGVTALINLDSAGINCKSMLFQVTDPRVVAAYSRVVPQPSAQAFGEALFQSGLVPSDTDFRIFRDFGSIHGVDIAFSKMGHVYHTRHDSLEMLQEGVIQHSGNMLYTLAQEMADSDEFYEKLEPSASVYWDYLNTFMLTYTFTTADVLDSLIIIFAASSVAYYHWMVGFRLSMTKELLLTVVGRMLAMAAGAASVWLVTAVMVATTIQLRYLANGWIVVPIYWMPFLIAAVATSQLFDAWRCKMCGLNRIRRVCQSMAATRLTMIAFTIFLLAAGQTATMRYVVTIPLLIMSAVSFLSLTAVMKLRLQAWQHIILELVLATPSLLLMFVIAIKINTLMLPIMGRSLTSTPDYLVAALNMLCCMLAVLPLSGIELLFSRIRIWTVMLAFSLVCLIICFIPLSPYRESNTAPALQRHNWFHSEVITYDQAGTEIDRRTGIWFGKTEVNTPYNILELATQSNIALRNVRRDFVEDCVNYTYCNLPMVTPRTIEYGASSMFVDFEPPTAASPVPELRLRNRTCNGNVCVLEFSMNGPAKQSLIIWPRLNVNLTAWSFTSPVKETSFQLDRPVYFIHYGRATYSEIVVPTVVYLTLQVPNPASSDPIVDISFNAHRISHDEEFTTSFKNLINAMPDYFNIEAYLSTRFNYVF